MPSRLQRLRRLASAGSAVAASPAPTASIPSAVALAGDWPLGTEAFPASNAQSRLWFLQQLEPGLTAYHMPRVWRLHGDLNRSALERALGGLIERHATLRTSFRLQGSEVLQLIHPPGAFVLATEELGKRDGEEVMEEWLEEERRTPFDLSSGLLLRARLLQVTAEEHVLLLNHHHIASDGWSLSVLARDLTELYNAQRTGRACELVPLRVQYQDYAAWQRQRLSGERLRKLTQYWIGELEGLEPLELPGDRARPAMPTHRGGSVSFEIGVELLGPFEELCRRERATLQMGLVAVVGLLLHRYSRQEDVAIGVPIWGRDHRDLEALIGFFINTLPVRLGFGGEPSFRDLLAQARERSIGAYEHQELPFEQMVEVLKVERDTSRNPLVQVTVQVMELPGSSLENFEGLEVERLVIKSESSKLDLSFQFRRNAEGGLSGSIAYARDLFDGERIERLSRHLIRLLGSGVETPDAAADHLNLLPEAERELIESWQEGPRIEVPELCVHQLFEQQVDRTPEATALIFEDQQLTYAELNGRANQLAHHLRDLGVGPEVIVGVCLERSVELIVSLLAILKAGGAYLPLDPMYASRRLRETLKDSQAPLVLTDAVGRESLCELYGYMGKVVDLAKAVEFLLSKSDANPALKVVGVRPGNLAYVIYTSGSTGKPKGVLLNHAGLVNLLNEHRRIFLIGADSRVLQVSSISFDIATSDWATALCSGAALLLCDRLSRQMPDMLSRLMLEGRITHVNLTPATLSSLPICDYVLETLIVGGEACPPSVAAVWGKRYRMLNAYGPTEGTVTATIGLIEPSRLITIGRPIGNKRIYILDQQLRPVPVGIPGEVFIGGAGIARGYLGQPMQTAERFLEDPYGDIPGEKMYRTGDLGCWLSSGELEYLGRTDFQIKLRGFRIEPGEIEVNLLEHPGVSQAVVVLRQDDPVNPRLIGYWVPVAGASTSAQELRGFLAERLPGYMVPAAFVELEALPLTSNGKLDRRALPAPSFASDSQQRVEPASELERTLHGIWVEVLGHEEFGITDNFFQIGGHSLAAARLVSRIEQTFGRAPALAAVFQHPTIAGLASLVVVSDGDGGSSALDIDISTAEPLPGEWPTGSEAFSASYAQSRLWFLHQLEPDLTAYHMPAVWRLRGALDVKALERALGGLIERHGTLRTSFRLHGSEVLQLIHPPEAFALTDEELGERDGEEVIGEWLEEERRTPFDLTSGVLLRARLLQVSPEEHVLLLNHHHIASDGWSVGVLSRDLTELYNAERGGRSVELPVLRVQYQDYAVWQRQRLSGERLRELNEYWIGELGGLEPLELPGDRARPVMPSHRGGSVPFEIGAELLEPFEELCRSEGATLQMGLLALVALLLHRTSRQDDFAIGVPIWGRNHPDLEPLMGFFINTLPVRTRFEAGQSFRELLAQVRERSIGAYEHQELPFEQMVEALNVERDTSRNPLVQVMVQLMELPESSLQNFDGLEVESLATRSASSKLDLSFYLRRGAEGSLRGSIAYARDLFEAERIERLSRHLVTLITSALQAPEAAADHLNLLPEAERELIESWQEGPPIELPELCVHQLFEQQVVRTPEATALIFQDQELSYAELSARANQLAHQLMHLGVGPEVIVGVCLERSVELIVSLLAILKAGGAYLPLDPAWPDERRVLLLRESGCTVLINKEGPAVINGPLQRAAAVAMSRLAYVTYTSGSTGIPKGVAIEHHSILRLVNPVNGFQLGAGSAVLQLAPVAFDAATFEIWGPLLNGGTLVVAPPAQPSVAELAYVLRHRQITTLWLTAGLFHALVDEKLEDLAGVRQVLAGGDVLSPEHVRRLLEAFPPAHELINGYGPTENTTFTCCHVMAASGTLAASDVPIGHPIAMTAVYVLDASGQPCPIGIPGEVYIGGAGLARGYLNNPELTAEKFIPDPVSSDPGARLYKSGDLASWNPDGILAFYGRIDHQIKLRGFRIEPGEIEANLVEHPGVSQAVVVLRQDDPVNPRLIGYWVGEAAIPSSPSATSEQLRSFLAERLPDYMVPSAFVQLEALPLTSNGKLDRGALPEPSFVGDLERRVEPATELERQLHGIWEEVLGHGEFGITDNFFQIGGHSLAAARLVSRIEQTFGRAPALAAVFQHPTIAGLASLVVVSDGDGGSSALDIDISTAEPLPGEWPTGSEAFSASYAQSRLWFLHQLEPDLTAYHMPAVWRLRGELDVGALERALGGLIERHGTLRSSFRLQGSEVLQIIHPPARFPLEAEPLGDRHPDAVVEQWLARERTTPFDLSSGRLIRARLLAVDHQHHLLLLNHHHIASDGWSRSVLDRDLTSLYNARRCGRSPELQPLRIHYQDYAAWQRQRVSADRLQRLKDYWIPQLRDLEPLELPTDHPRPATPSHQGDSVSFQIGPELLAPFEELCRSEGATLQMGLLALLALLLQRYSRQDDFAIGIPIWGRNHPDLEPLIGFFINTLPIRTHFTPQQSFRQLMSQVKAHSLAAYDHQELPFEQMVEGLNLARDTSRNPLVQVMLQLIELPESSLNKLDGLEVEAILSKSESSKLDLSFSLRRSGDHGLRGSIAYATDLFSCDRIERLTSHLLTLLSFALEAPDAPAASHCLLPNAERKLIESWHHGPTTDVPDLCVHELFEQQVERTPDAIALIFEDQQLTYSELNARANQLAHHLIDLGISPEVIVAVCLERSVELIISLLAVLKAGGAYLPIDPSWPEERQQLLLKETACSVLINQDGVIVLCAGSPQEWEAMGSRLAYVTYTSGSMGKPKGVAISHHSILRLVNPVNGFLLSSGHRVLQLAPVSFDAVTFEIWGPLVNGGTLVVAPAGKVALSELAGLLRANGISTLFLTTKLFHAMADSELAALAGVRQVLAGGEVLSVEHVRRLLRAFPPGHELIVCYGPTENTTFTSCQSLVAGERVEFREGPLGRPIAMTVVHVLDESGHPCPIGIAGELHIGGAGLARGYLNQPELTAEKFIPDPFSSDHAARLYKSGDLASWNPDGTLSFHGRIDEQVKLRGFRIEPGEIEATLLAHPDVAEAVVVLRQDDPANPRLAGYWVPDQGVSGLASSEQLRSFLAERLPAYMVPAVFMQLEALPLTPNSKLDRKALPAPSFSGDPRQRVEPSTDLERQLHAIWVDVLGHSNFGITDNFFAIGGHSLLTMQLKEMVDAALSVQVPVARYFSFPTIIAFSEFLQKANGSRGLEHSWHESESPGLERLVGPAPVHQFVEQQLTMLAHWPGQLAPGHQFVRTIGGEPALPSLFWCFQGADEFEGLAGELVGAVRVHGMRSAHELDNARQIYFNPALLYQVAGLYAREILEIQPSIESFVIGGNCQAGIIANAIAWHLVAHGRSVRRLILMEPSMQLIRQRALCWHEGTAILYGTDSFQNPFRAPSGEVDEQGPASIAFRQLPEDAIRRALRRSFGRGTHSVSFIPGVHGAFFKSSNLQGLAGTIKTIVLS